MRPNVPTILIIDDQPHNLKVIVHDLATMGFETLVALDGMDGLEKARSQHPDLILLDVKMPGWDGFRTCREIKSDPGTQHIPVLFLSALSDIEQKLRGFKVGGVDYITKPFQPQEVLARVSSHLRTAQLFRRMAGAQTGPCGAGELSPDASPPIDRGLQLVYKASDTLLEDLVNPPDMATLVRKIGTNHNKLTRLFQHHLGMTVFEWVREQRLVRAQALLATDGLQIQQVAAQIGFKRAGDFGTAFKRRFGMTPREYRQQYCR
jgi:CheY-like chemotaxis protein